VNLQLVREGMAVIYPRLFQACYSHRQDYYQAQAEAKQQQKGLWAQSNPLMPWEWRRRNRSPIKPDSGAVALNLSWQKSKL
jgi:micrococcal nuclease